MNREKVLHKIKILLAKSSDSSSPNEAVIAAKMARKLMDKHQLSTADIVIKMA